MKNSAIVSDIPARLYASAIPTSGSQQLHLNSYKACCLRHHGFLMPIQGPAVVMHMMCFDPGIVHTLFGGSKDKVTMFSRVRDSKLHFFEVWSCSPGPTCRIFSMLPAVGDRLQFLWQVTEKLLHSRQSGCPGFAADRFLPTAGDVSPTAATIKVFSVQSSHEYAFSMAAPPITTIVSVPTAMTVALVGSEIASLMGDTSKICFRGAVGGYGDTSKIFYSKEAAVRAANNIPTSRIQLAPPAMSPYYVAVKPCNSSMVVQLSFYYRLGSYIISSLSSNVSHSGISQ